MRARLWAMGLGILLWLLAGARSQAAAVPEFDAANRLYEQGKFGEAIARYEKLIESGKGSAAIWFNLGNARFKRGELGQAIYAYHCAEALSPRDPDIAANLRFARDRIAGSASVLPAAWERVIHYFTLNEMGVTTAGLLWVWLILLTAVRYRPAWRNAMGRYILLTGGLLVVSALWLTSAWASHQVHEAICVRQVTVHLGPLAESQQAYAVPDGTELRIENRRENWLQVTDRSNRTGWLEADKVRIFP